MHIRPAHKSGVCICWCKLQRYTLATIGGPFLLCDVICIRSMQAYILVSLILKDTGNTSTDSVSIRKRYFYGQYWLIIIPSTLILLVWVVLLSKILSDTHINTDTAVNSTDGTAINNTGQYCYQQYWLILLLTKLHDNDTISTGDTVINNTGCYQQHQH
ncbi:hypothetical protein HOLleu_00381 [Holothuria leucospilota]|uniref:Uncharacterized protein n=1 Tax=Holothuria leucospilota TaxID=206669 RepID=A0A9Q1HK77_HOLLE|nr:hypothetical protein HOLleu_00381 [Holothuria leucospilota]